MPNVTVALTAHDVHSCVACRTNAGPFSHASYSTQTSSTPTSATSHLSTGSSNFDTPSRATHRRRHSHGTPSHGHKVSNGSLNFNNLDLIAPSVPHAHMVFTAPVVQQRVHTEPLSDVLFSQYAVYTSDACGQVSFTLDFQHGSFGHRCMVRELYNCALVCHAGQG